MAGLNDFLTGSTAKATSLPQWYDTAQQNLVSQAQTGATQVPQLQNTVAGKAINNLNSDQNPFFTAQNQLQQIGAGAANPWIVDQTTGNVTPNTATPLGGLFQAQNQQLNQLLPNAVAPVEGANIASGNFGSLRGQTAMDKARGDAQANLLAQQMQAALQSQQTGVQAATGLGNVGSQGTSTMTTLGQAEQASPLTAVANLAKIISSVQAPATVTSTTQMAPLAMLGSLWDAAGSVGTAATPYINSILGTSGSSLGGLIQQGLKNLFSSSPNFNTGGTNVADDPTGAGIVYDNTNADNNPANHEISVPDFGDYSTDNNDNYFPGTTP